MPTGQDIAMEVQNIRNISHIGELGIWNMISRFCASMFSAITQLVSQKMQSTLPATISHFPPSAS